MRHQTDYRDIVRGCSDNRAHQSGDVKGELEIGFTTHGFKNIFFNLPTLKTPEVLSRNPRKGRSNATTTPTVVATLMFYAYQKHVSFSMH